MTEQPPDYTVKPFATEVHTERPPQNDPITGLSQNQANSLRGKLVESILQLVVQALTGSFIPGPLGAAFTQIASWGSGITSTITGILTGVINGVFSPIGGLLGGFLNAILGFGSAAIPAYTPANPAVSNVQGQVNALLGASLPGGAGMFDGFNTGPALAAAWTHICGSGDIITSDGIVFNPTDFECHRYNADRPATTFWQVQMSLAFVSGTGLGGGRVFGGADATLSTRFPAIEIRPNISGVEINLISLAGTPATAADRDLGRVQHDTMVYGFFVLKSTDVLALECNETTAIYHIYLNPGPGSTPICTYDDTIPNLIPRGAGHRDGGFQVNTANSSGFPGPGLDNFSLADRTP